MIDLIENYRVVSLFVVGMQGCNFLSSAIEFSRVLRKRIFFSFDFEFPLECEISGRLKIQFVRGVENSSDPLLYIDAFYIPAAKLDIFVNRV